MTWVTAKCAKWHTKCFRCWIRILEILRVAAECAFGVREESRVSKNEMENMVVEEGFFPRGAIAFFVTMLLAFGVIWLGLYFMLVQRQVGL